jgi:polysaccharide export outer membrane protein
VTLGSSSFSAFRQMAPNWAARAAATGLMALGLLACAAPPDPQAGAAPAPVSRAPDYLIGPGDALSVVVYGNRELSAEVPVRPDGRVSVPLVQDIQAAGKTPTQLATEIEGQLRRFVREPNVTVLVRNFVGQPDRAVRVIGEAAQPIAIPYVEGMTVLDVMIASKGLTRYAAGNRAEIVRRDADGTQRNIRVRLSDLLRDGDISQNLAMRPGDTLIIPQGWF